MKFTRKTKIIQLRDGGMFYFCYFGQKINWRGRTVRNFGDWVSVDSLDTLDFCYSYGSIWNPGKGISVVYKLIGYTDEI